MNKTPFLILLALLLGTGAILAWIGNGPADIAPYEVDLWLEDDPAADKPVDAGKLESGDAKEEEVDAEISQGLEELDREEIAIAEANTRHLVVQVWEGKKGVPAAAANVFFVDGFDGPELKDPFAQHWSDLAETRGRRFKTDAAGRVKLPPVQRWAIVTAQGLGTYGFTRIGRKHRDVETILLQVDETVTVQVVDGEDRPVAGAPVGVVQRVPVRQNLKKLQKLFEQMKMLEQHAVQVEGYIKENPAQREAAMSKMNEIRARQKKIKRAFGKLKGKGKGKKQKYVSAKPVITSRPELRAKRRTDADGIAVFRHFQAYRRQNQKWWPPAHVDRFEAVLLMPLQRPETRPFSGRPVPEKTIKLRMPPTGSLALRTVDLDGRPYTHPVHADLRMHIQSGEGVVPWSRVQTRKEQNEPAVVFPFVGLGLEFTAHCRLDDNDFRWSLPQFAGPSNAGERVTIDMVVAPKAGMLFGRVLDEKGQPLAGVRPSFLINSSGGRLEGEDVTLDKDGRFHLPYLVNNQQRPPFRLEIRRNNVRPVAGVAMPLARLPLGRVTDLGDLRLDAYGRITHGTVVDDRGQPLQGATVQLQRERTVGGKRPRLVFHDEAFVSARTDAQGQYELFGELEPGRYRLRAHARNHFPFETRGLRRGRPTDLRLQRNSRVVGTVLTPSWLRSRSLRVRLESAANPKQRREDRVHDHRGKKYIYFNWVKPGIYNVLIRVQELPDPILRIDSLEVVAGQQGVHRRLQDLDLRSLLYRFELKAVDGSGRPIHPKAPLLAKIIRPGGQTAFVGFLWRGTRTEILSTNPQLEVWPLSQGYRAENTVLGPGKSELLFLRLPPVDLNLPGLYQLVGATRVWVMMQLVGDAGLPNNIERWDGRSNKIAGWYAKTRRGGYGKLESNDIARVPLSRDGGYKVVVILGKQRKGGRQVGVEMGTVDVRMVPGAGPLQLTVKVDAAKVRAGLARLGPQ